MMKITGEDWAVVEAYMSDIHPTIRFTILNAVMNNESAFLDVSADIASEALVYAAYRDWEFTEICKLNLKANKQEE